MMMFLTSRGRATLFSLLLCLALPFGVARGQSQQQAGFNLKVPFTVRTLDPAIKTVRVSCSVFLHTNPTTQVGVGHGQSAKVPFRTLERAADGSYSGEVDLKISVPVPADAAGKQGSANCHLQGCLDTGSFANGAECLALGASNISDPRLKGQTGGPSFVGFTW